MKRIAGLFILLGTLMSEGFSQYGPEYIRPYLKNPYYWQYKNKPVMLIGGSKDDNLFQQTNVKAHLDEMVTVGANYIRNVMSDRMGPEKNEVKPYLKVGDKYDLNQWNPEYWVRFDSLLAWTHEREIFVQIEFWAFHDFFIQELWDDNPWNPALNVNYTYDNTQLKTGYGHPKEDMHDFFLSVPDRNKDSVLLAYQERFVAKIMEHSLPFPHVLYCVTNEIRKQFCPDWGWYWARFAKAEARKARREIEITEMYWNTLLSNEQHKGSLDHPDIFTYIETSQNSSEKGEVNWNQLEFARKYVQRQGKIRPLNAVKIYGRTREGGWEGTDEEAVARFWRNVIGGCASSRFHRSDEGRYGLGLGEKAKMSIKAMRMFLEDITPWETEVKMDLLDQRRENEAYIRAQEGRAYGVFFPNGGAVRLNMLKHSGNYVLRWINIQTGEYYKRRPEKMTGGVKRILSCPGKGPWAATIVKVKK